MMMDDGLRLLDIPSFDEKHLKQLIMYSYRDLIINVLNFFKICSGIHVSNSP